MGIGLRGEEARKKGKGRKVKGKINSNSNSNFLFPSLFTRSLAPTAHPDTIMRRPTDRR
jgi:hypothetical protein